LSIGGRQLTRLEVLFLRSFCILIFCAPLVAGQPAAPALPDRVTIDQAVKEAVEKKPRPARREVQPLHRRCAIITARLRPNPVFSAGLDYQDILGTGFRNDPNSNAGPPNTNFRTDFVLERGRKREQRIEWPTTLARVAQLQLLNTTRTLLMDVQSAFIDVLLAKGSLALARENLKSFEIHRGRQHLASARRRLGQGGAGALASCRAAVPKRSPPGRIEARVVSNRLQSLMGRRLLSLDFDVAGELRRGDQPGNRRGRANQGAGTAAGSFGAEPGPVSFPG